MLIVIILAAIIFLLLGINGFRISRYKEGVADYFYFPATKVHRSFTIHTTLVQVVSLTVVVCSTLALFFSASILITSAVINV